jgi:cytosine/adenosine deaminase-related metal-dependent hydrolase
MDKMILLKDGIIVPVDGKRRSFQGSVLIGGNRIEEVGDVRETNVDRVIDCSHKIIMPGMIDTHIHLAQALLRGCADDLPLIQWLNERVWPLQSTYDEELGSLSAELCVAEMLLSGTTTFLESGLHTRYGIDGIAKVVERSGMRGFISKMFMDTPYYARHRMYEGMIEDKDESMKEFSTLYERWNNRADGRIRIAFGARTPGACTPGLYREISEKAKTLDTVVTLHFCEIKEDVSFLKREYGMSPADFLDHCGLNNNRVTLAHCVWFDSENIARLKANVAHCPSSNFKLGSGIAPVKEMLDWGVNVTLGCDGAPCNNTYDIFRDLWLSSLAQKLMNPKALSAEEVLAMATVNGARALQIDAGSIVPGRLADIITIDLKPHHVPVRDPASAIVYCAKGSDVCDVLVDGEVVVENRVLKTINLEELMDDVGNKGLLPDKRAGRFL